MKKLMIAALLALGSVPFTYAEQPTQTQQAKKTVVLHVEEMNCQLCVYLVNKELRAVEGVLSTKASMQDRKVSIVAKPEVDNQTLIQAVEKLHYSAKVI